MVSLASLAFDAPPGTAQAAVSSESNIATGPASPSTTPLIPQQIRYSGAALERSGDTVEAVFRIYAEREGGEPLWSETQRVTIAPDGRYSVLLGSASELGLPQTVFAAGQARWLSVSIERGEEQPRTLLASVAYAMKAADAETLAGRGVAEFVTQEQLSAASKALAAQATALALPEVTLSGSGTTGYLPLWSHSSALGDSILFQSGTTKLGIATKTPATTLDVDGAATLRGTVSLPAAGKTADSPMLELSASVSAVAQNFAWRAVAATSANLELLFGTGSAAPAATGLAISPKGIVTFAKGQTFPGTGTGTITGVTAGAGLTGGGTSGPVKLSVDTSVVVTAVNAGLGLTGGGTGGAQTLKVDDTEVPLLAAANTFLGSQTFVGRATAVNGLTVTGSTRTDNLFASSQIAALPGAPATAAAAGASPTVGMGTSVFDSSNTAAVQKNFYWAAVPSGNNTASPSAQLNLQFASGGAAPASTGLSVSPTGIVTFASGQTFPAPASGPGSGTITAVSPGTALTGGGSNGTVTLNVDTTKVVTAVTAGTGLTGGGTGGPQTLSVDPTKIPLLGSTNTFSANDTFNGEITANTVNVLGNSSSGGIALKVTESGVQGAAVSGSSTTTTYGNGVDGASTGQNGIGVAGTADGDSGWGVAAFALDSGYGSTTNGVGVWAGTSYYGVVAQGDCCDGGVGVYSYRDQDTPGTTGEGGGVGVLGTGLFGVQGISEGWEIPVASWGVSGVVKSFSSEGASFAAGSSAGVWGDDRNGVGAGSGMLATADENTALMALNNSTNPTMEVTNDTATSGKPIFETYSPNVTSGGCTINTSADLSCSGTVTDAVAIGSGKTVAMYAVHSTENWFEDFGSGQLKEGSTHVALDETFAGTVNAGIEYHVFLTPNADCKGLYVAEKTESGFEVRELGGGRSSVAFDYRIVAKRRGFETVRMEDLTQQEQARQARLAERARRLAQVKANPLPAPNPSLHRRPEVRRRPEWAPVARTTAALAAKPEQR